MTIISKLLYKNLIHVGSMVKNNFDRITNNCWEVNSATLFKILDFNKNCEYGIKYNFKDIKTIEDFKNKIPLTEYTDYEHYIDKMANGEQNILCTSPIEYFGHTSGTTGKQKLIPVTKKSRIIASKYMALLMPKFSYENFKYNYNFEKGLLVADMVTTAYSKGGIPIRSGTSGGMNGIKNVIPLMYTSPVEVMEIEDKETAQYLHLLFALKEKKLMYISSVFISNILDILRCLEENYDLLVKDIRKGTINHNLNINEDIRKKLNKKLKPDANRANCLESAAEKGFKGICKRIWPEISYIATVTGANFSIYDSKVDYYTDSLPIYSPAYASTEGTIGINPYCTRISYVIIPDTVFYEFIPVNECNKFNPTTYLINNLKVGESYEIVITNYTGLYRYRLGDVVRVCGYYNNSPEIEFLYRRNQLLNMVSEKTTEAQLTSTIKSTISKLNLNLVDYTTLADNSVSPGRYIFYMEVKNDYSKKLVKDIETTLDLELKKSNLAYGRFRRNNRLAPIKVVLLTNGTFSSVKEFLYKKGISKSQIKIPRVITTNENIKSILKTHEYMS